MSNSPHHVHGLAPSIDFACVMTGGWYTPGDWFFLLLTLFFLYIYSLGNLSKKTFYTRNDFYEMCFVKYILHSQGYFLKKVKKSAYLINFTQSLQN